VVPDGLSALVPVRGCGGKLWYRIFGFTELHVSLSILFQGETALGDTPCYADDHC
jgi:hypothetical protein